MPNYNITIDSKFDPYSFEDYLKPAMLMQEQHNQVADAYATALANSAGLYDALRANEEDALAAKYVNDYENSLNELANDLATNGLNRTNRRGVYETKAKTGYIEKLKKAMDNRNTFIAQQNELINKDPSLVLSDYASNHGITRFLNPDFQYRSYSENALRQQAAKLFEELSKSTYLDANNPEYKRIAGLTMQMGIKAGLKPDDIQSAIDDIREHGMNGKSRKTTQILGNIAQGILISNLGERENNPYWSEGQWDKAMSGLMDESWHALGTEDFKTVNIDEPRATGSGSSVTEDPETQRFDLVSFASSGKRVDVRGRDKRTRNNAKEMLEFVNGERKSFMVNARSVRLLNSAIDQYTNSLENISDEEKRRINTNLKQIVQDGYGAHENYRDHFKGVDQGARIAQGYYSNYIPKEKASFDIGNMLSEERKGASTKDVAGFNEWLNNTGTLTDTFQYAGKSNDQIRDAIYQNLNATHGDTQIQEFSGLDATGTMKENAYVDPKDFKNAIEDKDNRLAMQFLVAPDKDGNDQLWELVTVFEKDGKEKTYRLPVDKNIGANMNYMKAYSNAKREFEIWDDDEDYLEAYAKTLAGEELTEDEQIAIEAHNYWDNETKRLFRLAPQMVANHRMYKAGDNTQNNTSNIKGK